MTHSDTRPLVSFCIPTFNRARYLASLLESLVVQLDGFPYPYELVIADNASPDATGEIVQGFAERLPIRYLRHDENIGCFPNVQYVMMQAAGRYVVYLADDDCILGAEVAQTIARMEADPEVAVVYAPWKLFDLVAQQEQGQFYDVPHDLRIERNAHAELLDHVLRHHIFPEIHIARRDALQRLMPRINEHAFFAFVHAADYLSLGAVLIQKMPFYVSITRYFADDDRSQAGMDEVEVAWDRYRGGLEYVLARAGGQITRRGTRRVSPAHPEDDRGAHVGRDPPAPCEEAQPARHVLHRDAPEGDGLRALAAGAAGDARIRSDARVPAPGSRDQPRRQAPADRRAVRARRA